MSGFHYYARDHDHGGRGDGAAQYQEARASGFHDYARDHGHDGAARYGVLNVIA